MNSLGHSHLPSHQEVANWEKQISHTIKNKERELINNKEVRVLAKSDFGQQIKEFATSVFTKFPHFPKSAHGSYFVKSSCTIFPKVVVTYSNLKPLLVEESKDSLLHHEVGKFIDLPPLVSSTFGAFTQKPTRLELTHMVFPGGSSLTPAQPVPQNNDEYLINSETTIGEFTIDPYLQKTEMRATIKFGEFVAEDQIIQVEISGEDTAELIIGLTNLNLSAKISHDGTVALNNHTTFCMDELLGDEPVTWYKVPFERDCEIVI